jgi:hypothetical protein
VTNGNVYIEYGTRGGDDDTDSGKGVLRQTELP